MPLHLKTNVQVQSGLDLALPALVDLIFLLLIFLMIGTSVIFQPGIAVNLPETQGDAPTIADKMVITYTRDRGLFFNDQRVNDGDWADLQSKLIEATQRQAGNTGARKPIIIVKADREVPYDDVVRILSIARSHASKVVLPTTVPD